MVGGTEVEEDEVEDLKLRLGLAPEDGSAATDVDMTGCLDDAIADDSARDRLICQAYRRKLDLPSFWPRTTFTNPLRATNGTNVNICGDDEGVDILFSERNGRHPLSKRWCCS